MSEESTAGSESLSGVVKWFNDAKGFGFIEHTSGKDVFVHYSVIESPGFKTLKDGEEVTYEFKEGPKGLHAVHVLRKDQPQPDATVGEAEQDVPQEASQMQASKASGLAAEIVQEVITEQSVEEADETSENIPFPAEYEEVTKASST